MRSCWPSLGSERRDRGRVPNWFTFARARKSKRRRKSPSGIRARISTQFKPIFEKVQRELETGERQTVKYKDNADVKKGDLFILDGQKVIVADMGETFVSDYGRPDRRLRVVYDNGTESDLLLRSLQRALNKDKASRRITEPDFGPLFSDEEDEDDLPTGYIYVLRSKSDHPFVAQNTVRHSQDRRDRRRREKPDCQCEKDPTYLLADVEIVATSNWQTSTGSGWKHCSTSFLAALDWILELKDRSAEQVEPREWFLVPLPVIEEAIEKIKDGSIGELSIQSRDRSD